MLSIFLVTEKSTQHKTLEVFESEKLALDKFSPRQFFIELLEKVPEPSMLNARLEIYSKTYKIPYNPGERVKIHAEPKKRGRRPGPWGKYNLSDEERERRRKAFSGENHPNVKNGFSEEHREKLRQAKLGKVGNFVGKTHTLEYKQMMSDLMKGNKHRSGWVYIYNPITGEIKNIRETDKLPDGYRYGKGKDIIENLYKEEE